jgi:hypothetical protein
MMMLNNTEISGIGRILIRGLTTAAAAVIILLFACPQLPAENDAAVEPTFGSFDTSFNHDKSQDADFRFGAPKGFIGFRIGKYFPRAHSDIYNMLTTQLTLKKKDFRAWDFGIDGGVNLEKRVDLIFSMDYQRRSKDTEFRDYLDENDLPITQTTELQQLPLTGGIKFLPVPRGRKVGQYAWLPSSIVPYISAGAGVLWYKLEQNGDFVDDVTLEIFPARLKSSGWTPTAYAGGGVDIKITKYTYLILDLRYSWAKPELGRDFVSFNPMDLSGLRVAAGLQWHF